MMVSRRGFQFLCGAFVAVLGSGCGDSGSTPTSPFGGSPCAQTTILQGNGSLPAYTADMESITTTKSGRLDVTLDWTSTSSTMLVAVAQDPCTFENFQAGTCNLLLNSSSPPKPLKGSISTLAAGRYVLFIGNVNSAAESVSLQVVSSSGSCPAASTTASQAGLPLGIQGGRPGLIRQ
jgi:hypothetical protein